MKHEMRANIEAIKNEKALPTYKKYLSGCSEIQLFYEIDKLRSIIKSNRNIDNETYPEWEASDKYFVMAELEMAISQAERFGVIPFKEDAFESFEIHDELGRWYGWWDAYIRSMSEEEQKEVYKLSQSNQDCSMYYPNGDWQESSMVFYMEGDW